MASLGEMFGAGAVETFLGLPGATPGALQGARMAILGADGCTPYGSVGFYCAGGPAAIRAAGAAYAANLAHVNFDLGGPVFPDGVTAVDCGDLPVDPGDAAGNRARLREAVARILAQDAVPVLVKYEPLVEAIFTGDLSPADALSLFESDANTILGAP